MMTNNPTVSIIIPVYNAEKYLSSCLDSVINQTYINIEIICVNDGSTDSSGKILAAYQEKDARIAIIDQKNGGVSSARNAGMDAAKGAYLSFFDDDDTIAPDLIEKVLQKCVKDHADICLYGIKLVNDESGAISNEDFPLRLNYLPKNTPFNRKDIPHHIFQISGPAIWAKMFRRDFLFEHQIRFPDLRASDDLVFSYTALILAERITYLPDRFYYYRVGNQASGTVTYLEDSMEPYDSRLLVKRKIESLGLYAELEKSYVNEFLSECVRLLYFAGNAGQFEKRYSALRDRVLPALSFNHMTRDFFFDPYIYCACRKVQSLSFADYQNESLLNYLHSEITQNALKSSISYRIGRALSLPLRKVRDLIK